jgi:hypothetical protein
MPWRPSQNRPTVDDTPPRRNVPPFNRSGRLERPRAREADGHEGQGADSRGSDSGGGAGIQADIKAVTALGGFAATAITALTAQNTLGVQGVVPVAPDFIRLQMRMVLEDIGADALKTGMLHDAATIERCATRSRRWRRRAAGGRSGHGGQGRAPAAGAGRG